MDKPYKTNNIIEIVSKFIYNQLKLRREGYESLVTGASSGIGRDIAKELSKKGYELILVARNKEKLEETQKKLVTNSKIICMDLSNNESCIKLKELTGDVDVLVNNAGFGDFGSFEETDLNKELDMIKTNIMAMHILTKIYLKDMKKKDKGYILNVASIAGFLPGPLMSTYYATKAYVVRLTESISEELRRSKSNVKISILCPGPVKTNFNNVANVKFSIPSQSSEYVAKKAVEGMFKNKLIIIPGIKIKMVKFFSKIVPDKILAFFSYNMQHRKYG